MELKLHELILWSIYAHMPMINKTLTIQIFTAVLARLQENQGNDFTVKNCLDFFSGS